MASLPKDIQRLLSCYNSLKVLENGKVQCQLSGHEMPCRLDAIEQYLEGKKYKNLAKKVHIDVSQYKEYLEPNSKPGHEHQLFCKLTWKTVNGTPSGIQVHVSGKRFRKALERWKICQENGTEFKPAQRLNARKEKKEEVENEDDGWDTDDSFSDLYPEADFKNLNLNDSNAENDEPKPERGIKRRGSTKITKSMQSSKAKRNKDC